MHLPSPRAHALLAFLLLAACGPASSLAPASPGATPGVPASPSGPAVPTGPAPTSVVVTVSPPSASVPAGGTASFVAGVTGTVDTSVTWSVQEISSGGAITGDGTYTAPPSAGTYHVVAASRAVPSATAIAAVTVSAVATPGVPGAPANVTVSVDPPAATLDACRGQVFVATVGGSSDAAVTWSVLEAGGGTVLGGVYAAPSTPGTYHVVATSHADPTASAQAAVTVGPEKVLSVAVSPSTSSAAPGGSQPFLSTLTTTCRTYPGTPP